MRAAAVTSCIVLLGAAWAASIPFVGGTPPAEPPDPIPWPRVGERAVYEAVGGAQIVYEVVGLATVNDVAGDPIETVRIDVTVRVPSPEGWRESIYSQYVDAAGHRALVAGPCATLGLAFPPPGQTCDDGRATATYLEHHLPAAAGASWFWGGRPRAPFHAHVLELAVPRDYLHTLGRECDRFEAGERAVTLDGQWFSADASPPFALEICADSAFPRRVTASWLDQGEWIRVSHHGGGASVVPTGLAVDPAALPTAEGASTPDIGIPYAHRDPDAPLDLPGAVAALLDSPYGRTFVEQHGRPFVRRAFDFGTGEMAMLGLSLRSTREWELALEADSGALLHGVVEVDCELLFPCKISVRDEAVETADVPTSAPGMRRSLPLATLRSLAVERMGAANDPLVTTMLRGQTTDLPLPAGYLHRFFGPPLTAGIGVPSSLHLDSRNGAPLHAYMDAQRIEGMTGYSPS